jgi:peptidoglycan/xylan/chitin deacetylase (PgdA/CDA1 family)
MINILKEELGWRQILEQEGLVYNVLSTLPERIPQPLIVNRNLNDSEVIQIRSLLNNGLSILTDFPNLKKIFPDIAYKSKKISYILNDGQDLLNNIIAMDLKLNGYKNDTVIFSCNYGKGYIIALPFDVNQAICDFRSERKPFYYPSRKFPNEIVSVVSKGAVRKLVVNCIRKLYAKMYLPYIHLWYYPNEYTSAFAFRVDTDFGPEDTLQATFDLENKTAIPFTYFINTREHPKLLRNQRDFQVHCYHHKVYNDYQRNYDNILKAKNILEQNGIKPIGFVSPFGFWNENLQKALEDIGIEYSSEFSLNYDDLPFFPAIENRRSSVLQIPVHPICIGRLVHASLFPEKCIDYYIRYFDRQVQANEPIFIYDHPHRIAQFHDIFYKILNNAKNTPLIWFTNLTEFYNWWKSRLQSLNNTRWQIENQSLKISTTNQDNKIYLHIITPNSQQTFVPLKQTLYNLKDLSYKSIPMNKVPDTEYFRRLKSKKTRLQIQFYETIDKIIDMFKG